MGGAIMSPLVDTRAQGLALQNMSRGFVTSGNDLNPLTGQGLTTQSSVGLSNNLQRMVSNGETGGFNIQDMIKVAGLSADSGMLNMSQTGDQIATQVKSVAKALKSFMRIAQEPDIRSAMQELSQMRQFGLNLPESLTTAAETVRYARMAGTTPGNIQATAGLPGAMTYQQLGMTAGLGYRTGMAAGGIAQQAVNRGVFTPGQLAMSGGMRGVQQTLTEGAGAALGIDFQTLGLLSRGSEGQLSIDQGRVNDLMNGNVSLSDMAGMAASNVGRLSQGVGAENLFSEFSTRRNELRNELGSTLGPQGSQMLMIRAAQSLRQELGGNISIGAALQQIAPGMATNQIRSLELLATSPAYYESQYAGNERRIMGIRGAEAERLQRMQSGSEASNQLGRAFSGVGNAAWDAKSHFGDFWESASSLFSSTPMEEYAKSMGADYVRRPDELLIESSRESARLQEYVGSEEYGRYASSMGLPSGKTSMAGHLRPSGWTQAKSAAAGLLQVGGTLATFGGGAVAAAGMAATMGSGAINVSSNATKMRNSLGGVGAWLQPDWLINVDMGGESDYRRKKLANWHADAATAGAGLRDARGMSVTDSVAVTGKVREEYTRLAAKHGVTGDRDFRGAIVTGLRGVFEEHGSMFGDKAVSDSVLKEKAKAVVAQSTSPAFASEFIATMWDNGLRTSTLRELQDSTPEDSTAGGAISKTAQVTEGVLVAANYGDLTKVLTNRVERLDQVMGTHGSSDEVRDAFRSALSTSSPEEMLVKQIRAAESGGNEGRAATLRSKLSDYVGDEDRVESLLKGYTAAAYEGEDKATRVALSRASGASEKHEGNTGIRLEVAKKQLDTIRATDAIGLGASKLAADYGISSLKTGNVTDAGLTSAMDSIANSPGQLGKLKNMSQSMYAAVQDKDLGAFRQGLKNISSRYGSELTLGGMGTGTKAEGDIAAAQGQVETLQSDVLGGSQGFANAVPAFAAAVKKLNTVVTMQEQLTRAQLNREARQGGGN
jgi:hypothetical protein